MLAVVGGLVALAAAAVIIFFAVDRWASGDDSSTSTSQSQVTETAEPEQEDISILSENGRGGGVQEQTEGNSLPPPSATSESSSDQMGQPTQGGDDAAIPVSGEGEQPIQPMPGTSGGSNSATAAVAESVQGPIVDDVRCSPWPPGATEMVTCTASLSPSGGKPDTYSWSGGDSAGSAATYVTSFDPSSHTQMVFLDVRNSAGDARVAIFGTWDGQHTATASDLLSGLEGIWIMRLRKQGEALPYGIIDGRVIPGSVDFDVRTGDVLWLNRTEVGNPNRSNVVVGRIIMRVVDGTNYRGEDDWRIEFGFLPEWAMDSGLAAAVEAWSELLPMARYFTKSLIDLHGDRRWLHSSPIAVPTQPVEAAKAPASEANEVIGRVVARYNPDSMGRLRIEFGFRAQGAATDTAISEGAIAKDGGFLLPQARFITESMIANQRNVWMRSSVVEVPVAPAPSTARFARCSSDEFRVYYLDDSTGTKHWLNLSGEQANLIFGSSWWSDIWSLSQSECDRWETGREYGVTEAMRIGES